MTTRISSYCNLGNCVAVTRVDTLIWLHRSTEPWYRGRWFTPAEFDAFTAAVAAGEFTAEAMESAT